MPKKKGDGGDGNGASTITKAGEFVLGGLEGAATKFEHCAQDKVKGGHVKKTLNIRLK